MLKRLSRSPTIRNLVGDALAGYLKLVRRTSRYISEPEDFAGTFVPQAPLIIAMWHGQHFAVPFIRPPGFDVRVLISQSADGEINARAAARLGLGLIRGSGGSPGTMRRKRGHAALREMLRALEEGATVALTADVPKTSRVAGPGIVTLARHSGRPIVPVAVVTSRRITANSWDKASIHLPFSRMVCVGGDPIFVPDTDDPEVLEAKRKAVEDGLNAVHERAFARADSGP